jgi:hypothetical protein
MKKMLITAAAMTALIAGVTTAQAWDRRPVRRWITS